MGIDHGYFPPYGGTFAHDNLYGTNIYDWILHNKFVFFFVQIAAERLPTDLNILKKAIRIIDKDVPRTDRELEYFRYNFT